VIGADRPKLVVVEGLTLGVSLDPFLSLRGLASYAGLSVRRLREYLTDPEHPLPCYRVGGKVLVRKGEFDAWIARHRHVGRADIDHIVNDLLGVGAGRPRRAS
jgi:hypothetical protein